MAATLIRSGKLITANETFVADILLEDEKISAIGTAINAPDAEVIDAENLLVMPGGVDPHVHLDLPMFGTVSSDDHYTGMKAAAFGGTTTVLDFIPLDFPTLKESADVWMAKAVDKAAIDYSFHINVTRWDEAIKQELPSLAELGITSVKVFTAYNRRLRLMDDEIFQVMRLAGEHGLLTLLHAENGDVIDLLTAEALAAGHTTPEWHAYSRPGWGAVETVLRAVALSAQTDAPLYVVHLNTAGGLDQIRYGRDRGVSVMAETCPQYLFFTVDDLRRADGAKWVCSPPMRTLEDNAALMDGLSDGSIQTFGTDHCPFFFDGTTPIEYEGEKIAIPGKELGAHDFTKIPNGLPGVGDRMPILWTYGVGKGKLSPQQFVALTSTNPARIFGMYPNKGSLSPGADADIVIWDPNKRLTYGVAHAQHRTDYNLYEGWPIMGYPHKVFLRGQCIVDQGQWHGKPGMGRLIKRTPGAEVL